MTHPTYTLEDLAPKMRVFVSVDWGKGPVTEATITSLEKDIKPGEDGFCYVDTLGKNKWAYLHQLRGVRKQDTV